MRVRTGGVGREEMSECDERVVSGDGGGAVDGVTRGRGGVLGVEPRG